MKYIDADKLIERLEEMKRAEYENCGGVNSKTGALQEVQELIDSFQQKQPEVDLKMVVMIDNIVMNMIGEGYNDGYKTRPFYEEVVRRINARKK